MSLSLTHLPIPDILSIGMHEKYHRDNKPRWRNMFPVNTLGWSHTYRWHYCGDMQRKGDALLDPSVVSPLLTHTAIQQPDQVHYLDQHFVHNKWLHSHKLNPNPDHHKMSIVCYLPNTGPDNVRTWPQHTHFIVSFPSQYFH